MVALQTLMAMIGVASLAFAAIYTCLALIAVLVWRTRKSGRAPARLPPVTILKPLCGAEPGLYENLRSFCRQSYPQFQIVFGVGDVADPALSVVERLVTEFPHLSMDVVVDPQQHGHNRKISSLINMLEARPPRRARHGGQRRVRGTGLSHQRHGSAIGQKSRAGHVSLPRRAHPAGLVAPGRDVHQRVVHALGARGMALRP